MRCVYDGVRRVQEVFTDPKPGTFPEKVHQGDPSFNPVYITATKGVHLGARRRRPRLRR